MKRTVRIAATMVACALMGSSAAYAQATRTWVSGVGDDANPCSRTAPCKTFAGAISKTAAGGEISVLDPGGFGGVTITKSITIDGRGTLASILVGAGTNGVIINAAATDVVTLRNLTIHGVGATLNGIRFIAGKTLVVDNVDISVAQNGIDVESSTANANVIISNTTIRGGTNGIQVTTPGGGVRVSVDRTSIRASTTGIDASGGAVAVTNSVLAGTTFIAFHGQVGTHSIDSSQVSGNRNVGIQAAAGATVSVSGNSIMDNVFAFGCGGGTIASTGDNRVNTGGGCPPNATVTVQ